MKRLLAFLFAFVFSALAWAQGLTPQQLTVLAAHIRANNDPPVVTALANGADNELARLYSLDASPAFLVWRTNVTREELMRDAGFDWTRVDNLSVGKARIWDWMFAFGSINAAQSNIRTGIDTVWVGTAADLAVRTAIYAAIKRSARLVEKVFATGTGSAGSPATMVYEGAITGDDVSRALRP